MTFELWLLLAVPIVLVIYVILRLLFVWTVYGGGGKVDYYGDHDSEK